MACGDISSLRRHTVPRICFVLAAGLDKALLSKSPSLATLSAFPHRAAYQPSFPAVTCTAQATLTTGTSATDHGIICNGLYTHGNPDLHQELDLANHADARVNVSFWEQSNGLVQKPRFWQGMNKKVAMLFWQQSMPSRRTGTPAADIVITPKPEHTPDGKTLTACWSAPADLYASLVKQLGPFPLFNYWSPMAGLPSSQWIVKAAEQVWSDHKPDLQLVYIPHLDFNLLRHGPSHPSVAKDLQDVDALLAPLAQKVRGDGGVMIVAGDYGMFDVTTPVMPNLALRDAGLLATKINSDGKLLIDYDTSNAFVMADHQVAFLYAKPAAVEKAIELLARLEGIASVQPNVAASKIAMGSRAGQAILLAKENAWFAHDWWHTDAEKPLWQFSVDIHNKPGFDPRELFFDPVKKMIAQDAKLVKGSHGLTHDPSRWPVLLSDVPLEGLADGMPATAISSALASLLA
jgi:hypothetical protein